MHSNNRLNVLCFDLLNDYNTECIVDPRTAPGVSENHDRLRLLISLKITMFRRKA